MKKLSLILCILFITTMSSKAQYTFDSIPFGGYQRSYVIHLPPAYNGITKLPLVMAFHGGGGVGWQSIAGQSQLTNKSDSAGFILVYPEGVPFNGFRGWNAGGCCPYSTTNNVNDVGFVNAMLDTLINQYAIDTNRVYATGSSNGGIFCFRLACELPHRIAAIATIAATSMFPSCNPSKPTPILNFHSFKDLNVPYNGGIGIGNFQGYFPSQDSTLKFWRSKLNCGNANTTYLQDSNLVQTVINNCDCNTQIIHYGTKDGGHSWPGGPNIPGKDSTSKYISATYMLWEFFKNYTLGCNTTGIEEQSMLKTQLQIFPNPSGSIISLNNLSELSNYSIYNTQGQLEQKGQTIGEIDIKQLKQGLHILYIQTSKSSLYGRFIKTE